MSYECRDTHIKGNNMKTDEYTNHGKHYGYAKRDAHAEQVKR